MKAVFPVVTFTRRMIQEKDFRQFLDKFDLRRPEAWRYLPELLGKMIFHFDVLDQQVPLWRNPALRQFLKAFHRAWPHWSFFCDLAQEDLRLMTFACLQKVTIIASR